MSLQGKEIQANPMLLLAGPTAVGKSEIALRIAERLGGEIVSVDSMQVYRGMVIGTAKPSLTDRARVPHYLVDVVDVSQPFDAAQFVKLARQAIADIQAHRRMPVLCGGTGLYFKALLEGIGDSPASDPELRNQLERAPLEHLLAELAERDPETYKRIDRKNPRRVIRALEVIRLTGQPFSLQRSNWKPKNMRDRALPNFWGLRREPGDLRARINSRVDEMFRNGLVEETETLLALGLNRNKT